MSPHRTMQVEAIKNGTVIDHIPAAVTLRVIELITTEDDQVFMGMNLRSGKLGNKGVIKITDRELSVDALNRLALLAPTCTLSIIRDYQVVSKEQVHLPDSFESLATCPNGNCITNFENWPTKFKVIQHQPLRLRCFHCERSFSHHELI